MKNARLAGAAAVALTAALTLSACLPPHQNDSDQPFENNQTGLSTPVLDDGTGETTGSSAANETAGETANPTAATTADPAAGATATETGVTDAPTGDTVNGATTSGLGTGTTVH
ncbi:hypothetical protein [uncultured Corynebacterium sp.]|uniref:hypothetical protein n=1 Tax=uncultured Corynebacterium sp. TaxID=159447 RepID=UPI0025986BD2|nr:hypothetical protein [uncultured Corynebacterium sp.]